jgi:hypothetical protein
MMYDFTIPEKQLYRPKQGIPTKTEKTIASRKTSDRHQYTHPLSPMSKQQKIPHKFRAT